MLNSILCQTLSLSLSFSISQLLSRSFSLFVESVFTLLERCLINSQHGSAPHTASPPRGRVHRFCLWTPALRSTPYRWDVDQLVLWGGQNNLQMNKLKTTVLIYLCWQVSKYKHLTSPSYQIVNVLLD